MIAKFVSATYKNAQTLEVQVSETELNPYKERGYKVVGNSNGIWILYKPAQILVNIVKDNHPLTFRVLKQVLELYNEQRASEELFEIFQEDAQNGAIQFTISENGVLSIQKN